MADTVSYCACLSCETLFPAWLCTTENVHCLSTVTAYLFLHVYRVAISGSYVEHRVHWSWVSNWGSRAPGGGTSPCSWKLFVHSHTTKRPKVDRSPASPPNLKHSHDQPILLANRGGASSPPIPGSTSAIKLFLFKMSLHICMCVVW